MNIEEAFRKVLMSGHEIERVINHDSLYEIEINGTWKTFTEDEVISFANGL